MSYRRSKPPFQFDQWRAGEDGEMLSLELDDVTLDALQKIAAMEGISVQELVVGFLESLLDEMAKEVKRQLRKRPGKGEGEL